MTEEGTTRMVWIPDDYWYKPRLREGFKLSDENTTSEYERGFIDGWNEIRKFL